MGGKLLADVNGHAASVKDVAHIWPWDRQLRETKEAFGAFALYRDLGDHRSVAAVSTQLGRSAKLTRRWSVRWRWVERAIAWDRELDRVKQSAMKDKIVEVAERHAKAASAQLAVLMAPAMELGKRLQEKRVDLKDVKDASLIRMVQQGAAPIRNLIEVERLSMGLPSLMTAISGSDGAHKPGTVADVLKDMFRVDDDAQGETDGDEHDAQDGEADQGEAEDGPRSDGGSV